MIDVTLPMELADGTPVELVRDEPGLEITVRVRGRVRSYHPSGLHMARTLPNLRNVPSAPIGHNGGPPLDGAAPQAPKLTGGSSSYYKLDVTNPTSGGPAYSVECNDIIEALGMNFAEGNAFKALWRIAAERMGNGKPGTTSLYDSEKVVFFGQRLVVQNAPQATA